MSHWPITAKQQAVLDWVVAFIKEHGYPPTRLEMAKAFGFKSANSAECHLRALESKGRISIAEGKARSITVLTARTVL